MTTYTTDLLFDWFGFDQRSKTAESKQNKQEVICTGPILSVLCHFRLLNSFELHSNRSSPQFFGNRSGNNLSSIKVFFYFCPTAVATASRTILHQKINYDLEREKDSEKEREREKEHERDRR